MNGKQPIQFLPENMKLLLKHAKPFVAPKTANLQVLTHVSLCAMNGRIRLQATNLEAGYTGFIGAKIDIENDEDFQVCVPFAALEGVIKKIKLSDSIGMRLEKRTATLIVIDQRGNETRIKGVDFREFPVMPAGTSVVDEWVRTGKQFKEFVISLAPIAATDGSRPTLTGLHLKDGKIEITDGYTMGTVKIELSDELPELLIPAKPLAQAAKQWRDDFPVRIQARISKNGGGQVIFSQLQHEEWVFQLLDHKYPDFGGVLPKIDFEFKMHPNDLLSAIDAVETVAKASLNTTFLYLEKFTTKYLNENIEVWFANLTAAADEIGDVDYRLDAWDAGKENRAPGTEGKPCGIGMDFAYLRKVLMPFKDRGLVTIGTNMFHCTDDKGRPTPFSMKGAVITCGNWPVMTMAMPMHITRERFSGLIEKFHKKYPELVPAPVEQPVQQIMEPVPAPDATPEPVAEIAQPVSVEEPAPVTAPTPAPSEEDIDMATQSAYESKIAELNAKIAALEAQQPTPAPAPAAEAPKKPKNPNVAKAHEYANHIGDPCPFCGKPFHGFEAHPSRSDKMRATFEGCNHTVNVPTDDALSFEANVAKSAAEEPQTPAPEDIAEGIAQANADAVAENAFNEAVGDTLKDFAAEMMEAAGHKTGAPAEHLNSHVMVVGVA